MPTSTNIAILAGQLVVGGAERQLYLWLANLDRERFNPIVLTLHPGFGDYWEKPIEDLGIPLFRINQRNNRISRLREIRRILQPFQPQLVHGWHLFSGAYASLVAPRFKAKSLVGIRNIYSTRYNSLELQISMHLANAFITNSTSTAKEFSDKNRKKLKPVYIVPNAVLEDFEPRESVRQKLTQELGLRPDALWLVGVGRLVQFKHFDELLEVAASLRDKQCNFHLILIGGGPEESALIQLSQQLHLKDCVRFTGEIPNAIRLLKGFDIFCMTSFLEGLPNVVMEAAAAGLPIVTWQLPFYEELLTPGETALMAAPGDRASFEQAVQALINDQHLRERLGAAAQTQVTEKFSLDHYIQNMTKVYETMLQPKPSPDKK
jgi:glycosyltransferase involved in cell wall biosynthesis